MFSTTLTYLINVEYGINKDRQNFFYYIKNARRGEIHFYYMKKVRGWGTRSGKTISKPPRLLDR